MEAKTIMIDMDNVITDGRFLDYVDEFLGTNYILEDMKGINVLNLLREKNKEFWEWVKDKDFYEDAPLLEGCFDVLHDLYQVYETNNNTLKSFFLQLFFGKKRKKIIYRLFGRVFSKKNRKSRFSRGRTRPDR